MTYNQRENAHRLQIKKMGWTFIILSLLCIFFVYLFPNSEANYWLSKNGKEGFYVLSSFILFLGVYCLGALKRQ